MRQSRAQIYVHIVFSTKQRHPYFVDDASIADRSRLQPACRN